MGSPEATLASAEGVGTPEGLFEELSGTLQGWKRKISGKKGGTPKKKDVCFLAPDGEEVKNKRQLDKYLKAHPGTLMAADFDWGIPGGSPATPGDQPRRSARLTSKIRSLFDGFGHDSEVKQPSQKRSRKSRDHVKEKTVAGLSVDKKVENGEGKTEGAPTEENKAMDVDPSSAEAPAKTEVSTKEPVTGRVDVDDPYDAVVGKAAESDFAGGPGTEVYGKQQDAVPVNEDEKANGEKLVTPILKTKEERRGNDSWNGNHMRSGSDLNNLQPCSTSSTLWDPTDGSHILTVKKALHLSAVPSSVLCRDVEQKKVVGFCKASVVEQIPGSLYVCGCPGTGKSLTMEQIKSLCVSWATEANLPTPEVITVNCTTLTDPRNIYHKVLQLLNNKESEEGSLKSWSVCLKEIRHRVCDTSQARAASPKRMLLMLVDEMDYLITRNQDVLYDLFRLPTYPNSRCILIGIANAIDLTDRFLPKLWSLNCKPDVVTFPAYTKDQILAVLTQRLKEVPFTVFHMPALELCARKVAAASGDMRKALHVCRSALEILETELNAELNKTKEDVHSLPEREPSGLCQRSTSGVLPNLVRIDHMAKALARTFRSPVVETIQNLPQHQQMVLCSAVRLFRRAKKDATLGELNKSYLEFCKSNSMHALAGSEFSSMCRVLADQALLKLGECRDDRLRRVTLQVNQDDVVFALQAVRFFRNSLS